MLVADGLAGEKQGNWCFAQNVASAPLLTHNPALTGACMEKIMTDEKPKDAQASDVERIVIRMQLYKEIYILNQGEIRNYAGNIAAVRAEAAVAAFDELFCE